MRVGQLRATNMKHHLLTAVVQVFNKSVLKFNFKASLLLITLIFNIVIKLHAQDNGMQFTHLTSENGLSMNNITCMIQDSKGFIWIGTPNGLNRYDGYKCKIFTPDTSDLNSLSDRTINCLAEDSKGNIWVGTSNGLNKYDWKDEKFYRYKNDPDDENSISNNFILSLLKDKTGILWVGTLDGLNKYNLKQDNFTVIKKVSDRLNPDLQNSVTGMEENYEGNLWLGTWDGLTCIRKDGTILKQLFAHPAASKYFTYRFSSVLYEDNDKNLWIGTNGQSLYKYNQLTEKMTHYDSSPDDPNSISNNYITSILRDKLNHIWVGTLFGLNKYNPQQNNFTRIYNNYQISSSLINNTVYSIMEDNDGLLWVGTYHGISKYYQSENKFISFNQYDKKTGKRLISDRVISIFIDKHNNIWDATIDGVYEIKDKTNQIIYFSHIPGNPNSLVDNFVRSVFVDHKGFVWMGTNNSGLERYDPDTGKFKLFTYDANNNRSISNNGITTICEDDDGNLWFGTWWGLNFFDRKTEKFTRYFPNAADSNSIKSTFILDICKGSKGKIWVATNGGGVSEIDIRTKKITNFYNGSNSKNYISDNKVYTIFESADGILWFGTTTGLNSYNPNTGKTTVYTEKKGLSGDLVNAIQEDNKGFLWIATDKGLSKFDRKSGVFYNYGKKEGLSGLEFLQNIAAKSKDGFLYFGIDGIIYFNPDSIKDEYLTAPVVLTDLKIFNRSVPISPNGILRESITTAKTIYVPHGEDVITLDFALLDYFDVKKNTFRYKLDGFDIGWNDVGTRNSATYTNLSPGEYTFYVRATNNNGIKNEKEASLKIIIVPEFYQTWLFRISFGLGLLLIIVFIFQTRTRTIQKRNKILENKVFERTRDLNKTIKDLNQEIASKDKFFSIIAHDLRSPFVALLGFSKLLVDEINNLTKDDLNIIAGNILKSARQTFGLLENLLHWARIKTGRIVLEPEKINLKEVLNEITELYRGNAASKGIVININANNTDVFADLNMVQTILRNLISNSIKFTGKNGKVYITVNDEKKFVRVTVADTGVGIEPDRINKLFQIDQNISTMGTQKEEGSGLGLILCKEFIELNKGEILVKSKLGEGSEFSFTLPKFEDNLVIE